MIAMDHLDIRCPLADYLRGLRDPNSQRGFTTTGQGGNPLTAGTHGRTGAADSSGASYVAPKCQQLEANNRNSAMLGKAAFGPGTTVKVYVDTPFSRRQEKIQQGALRRQLPLEACYDGQLRSN